MIEPRRRSQPHKFTRTILALVTDCPICSSKRERLYHGTVLGKYGVDYLFCSYCGLLQTEAPYWLEEAYSDAIALSDTGIIGRNNSVIRKLTPILFLMFGRKGRYLDVAGGYGLLTRMMRDVGFDFYWSDPYCRNIFARGFEGESIRQDYSAVTAIEVLEHTENPLGFVRESLEKAGASTVLLTTELYSGGRPPPIENWWYYALSTGQHISFFHRRTLFEIAKRLSLYCYSHKNVHMFSKRRLPHFAFALATGKASFVLSHLVRLRMRSLTLADHELLVNR